MRMIFTLNKYYKTLLSVVLMSVTSWAVAQERTVNGTVTSAEDGTGLPGVSVLIDGTQSGTITDIEGNYSLTVPNDNSSLIFSFIGFEQQKINVAGRSTVSVELAVDLMSLDGVVLVG